MSIVIGYTRLRLGFMMYNHCHTLTFESEADAIFGLDHYYSPQYQVCLCQFKHLTAAWHFQCLIMSIMNGYTRLRLGFIVCNGHHNLILSHELAQMWLDPHPLFTPRLSLFGLIQASCSFLTLPVSHYEYSDWSYKVEIGIHDV